MSLQICLILLEEIPFITARKMDTCKCYFYVFTLCVGGVTADRKGIRYKGTGGNTAVSWQLCLLLVRCAGVHDSP